jgi:hypothetical protein
MKKTLLILFLSLLSTQGFAKVGMAVSYIDPRDD